MSALINLLTTCHKKKEKASPLTKLSRRMSALSEPFWFTMSLALFVVMGPFSIIAVIVGLHNLATKESNGKEPEPVKC